MGTPKVMKTPVPKCIRLALFTQRMLTKFNNPNLAALATKLEAFNNNLIKAQNAYGDSVTAMIPVRVDVRFIDYTADDGVRAALRNAESADGKKGGKIASQLFPNGVTPIVRPVGETEVKELRDLEGRYDTLTATWQQAAPEKAKIVALRTQYEAVLAARKDGMQTTSNPRAARNAAKEDFLDIFAFAAGHVKAEFPRDRAMQDLFFDRVTDAVDDLEEEEPPAPVPAPAPTK
jgi:hypothetical protein